MYNVSEEYIEKINSLSKKVYWYGTVFLTNGTEYPFDTTNMSGGQTSITRELCNASSLKMGGTCSAELKISLMLDFDGEYYRLNDVIVNQYEFKDAKVSLYFRLFLDDNDKENYEEIPMGNFTISEAERKQYILSLVAYDYMQKFGKECISTIQGTPYNILLGACAACGVELGSTYTEIANMVNGRKSVAMYDPKNQISIWRDVVGYIAEMLGGNAVIKYDNKLYIIPFKNNPQREFTPNNRVSLTLADYISNYNALTATNLRNNTEDRVKKADGGLTYQLGANPLMQYVSNAERQAVLGNLLNLLNKFEYVPFDGEFYCDPSIEVGDVIAFSGNHAMTYTKSIVTQIELSVSGHMKMKCEGDNPYLAIVAEAADRESAQNKGGTIGDGVTFYDYTNIEAWTVTNEQRIATFLIDANGKYRNEFIAELLIIVETNEVLESGTWTETDCSIVVTYYLNNVEIGSYKPNEAFTDGKHILHLFYPWGRDDHITYNAFEAKITVRGGTITIGEKEVNARIMQSGKAYPTVSNKIAYIEVETPPNNEMYWRGQPLNYAGVKIVAEYEDGRIEDITNSCVFNPANGSIATEANSINVAVTYTADSEYKTAFYMEEIVPEELLITPPTITTYYVDLNEKLDYTGLIVIAKFSNGSTRDVTNICTYSPANRSNVNVRTPSYVAVTYNYFEKKIEDGFDITIVYPDSLEITPPYKTTYYLRINDKFNYDGISVKLKYENGTKRDITEECLIYPDEGRIVTEKATPYVTVTYRYQGRTVTDGFDIEIKEIEFDLKYFDYEQYDDITSDSFDNPHRIIINGLKTSAIVEDGLTALEIPDTYVHETGIVYLVGISDEI